MGRLTPGSHSASYGHRIRRSGADYVISWAVDYKPVGVRYRMPRSHRRYTDEKGARRFAKKWGVPMPEEGN